MVLRTFVAHDSEALVVVSSSSGGIVGNPIVNNSSTPNGTIFQFTSGFATNVTLDDTGGSSNIFDDDDPGNHIITEGGGIVQNGNQVESESVINVRLLDAGGNETGPEIALFVLSQNGAFGDVWGFSTDAPLINGAQYVKVSGSNAGASTYTDFITCFAEGTLIQTERAAIPVETIKVGQNIWTLREGSQPVRWVATTSVVGHGTFAPVVFAPGAIGNTSELIVSQQHRIRVASPQMDLVFGVPEVLVSAKHLVGLPGVTLQTRDHIAYTHFMFDRHQIVSANGALTESFFLGRNAVKTLDAGPRKELLALFPSMALGVRNFGNTAAMTLTAHEASVLRSVSFQPPSSYRMI